jgi:hypothetical protein
MQEEFSKYHDKVFDIAEPKYLKKVKMTKRWAHLAKIAYSFNKTIRKFCGEFPDVLIR